MVKKTKKTTQTYHPLSDSFILLKADGNTKKI